MDSNKKTSKLFYGWWVVGASFVIAILQAGIIFYGFTTVFEPIAYEMRWSYTQISLAASLRGLVRKAGSSRRRQPGILEGAGGSRVGFP